MRIKALRGFSGMVTMAPDEIRDVREDIAKDLIGVGYAEAVKSGAAPTVPDSPIPSDNTTTAATPATKTKSVKAK